MLRIRSNLWRNFSLIHRQNFCNQNKKNEGEDFKNSAPRLMLGRVKDEKIFHKTKESNQSSFKKIIFSDKMQSTKESIHDKRKIESGLEHTNADIDRSKPKPFLKSFWQRKKESIIKEKNSNKDDSRDGEAYFSSLTVKEQAFDFNFTDNKLPGQLEKKWEDFFYRTGSKVFLTLDRAINNMPDAIYLEFVNDSLQFLNEHQLTFVLKNLFLHRSINVEFDSENLLEILTTRITQTKNLNFNSKDLILSLLEVIHLFPQPKTNQAVEILETIVDNMRLLAMHFTNEQFLFILKVCLENSFYDMYMINSFKQRFKTDLEFINLITYNLCYKFGYFKYPIKVNDAVLKIVEAYIDMSYIRLNTKPEEDKYSLFNKEQFPQVVVQLLENFFESVLQGTLDLDQIASINFNKIISIFDVDTGTKWERALNNLIMTHIGRVIEPYQNNLFSNPLPPGEVIKIVDIVKKFDNDAYSREQFEDLFSKLCDFAILSNSNLQNDINVPNNQNFKMISKSYKYIITSLLQISITNNMFNPYIIAPYLKLLRQELTLSTKQGEKKTLSFEMVKLFGQYNFDLVLKKYNFPQETLDDYFSILLKLDGVLSWTLSNYNPSLPHGKFISSFLVNENNNYKICKTFYTTLEEENKYIVSNSDVIIPKLSGMHLVKFNSFPKNILINYYLSKYNLVPSVKVTEDLKMEKIANDFEVILDSFITAINHKVVTITQVEKFLEIVEGLYNNKSKDINLFDYYLKEVLLRNTDIYSKLAHVVSFILYPENYYNITSSARMTITDVQDLMMKEYSLENFTGNKETIFDQHIEEEKRRSTVLKDQLATISNDTKSLINYVTNYWYRETNSFDKQPYPEFESTNYKLLQRDYTNLYYNPNQISLTVQNDNMISCDCHPKLTKLIMDMSKISTTIDKYILSHNFSEISSECNNFYLHPKRIFNVDSMLDKTVKFTDELRNFSEITLEEIYNSPMFYQMLKMYLITCSRNSKVKYDFKKLNQKFENLIKVYPLTPYMVNYAFTINNQIEWLSVINTKYLQTEIQTIEFRNKLSFLKSHINNILILN